MADFLDEVMPVLLTSRPLAVVFFLRDSVILVGELSFLECLEVVYLLDSNLIK